MVWRSATAACVTIRLCHHPPVGASLKWTLEELQFLAFQRWLPFFKLQSLEVVLLLASRKNAGLNLKLCAKKPFEKQDYTK